ncbi:MAG TPA: ABC transporter permease [Nocardioidaceae bacterium]|jgi:putative spermidine/putrescine transport system permease protein|nr:ABC transporter permease [Nocardioidaceae bacterium]
MTLSRRAVWALRGVVGLVLAFIYIPLLVVVINAFNPDRVSTWPPSGFTVDWWRQALTNQGAIDATWVSAQVALCATVLALVLGTLASFALQRYAFFGRDAVSLLVILPIALPGIVTGLALNSAFTAMLGVDLGFFTLVVAHSTFCIVVVFNNVIARLRRLGENAEAASMDLGATRLTTFRLVTFPALRSALLAGALLAFALSFDEIIVTTFTAGAGTETLPIWILNNLSRPNNAPVVNVVGTVLIAFSILPIYLSQKLSGDPTGGRL